MMKYIGIDLGSKTLKIIIGNNDEIEKSIVREHFSAPLQTIEEIDNNQASIRNTAARGIITGCYQHILANCKEFIPIDWTIPVVKYCAEYFPEIQFIIDIGATSLSLLEIKEGKFHRFQTNSLCASGTGSFLDQQMKRMNLTHSDVERIQPTRRIPSIASRCAVFAKSDLIHRQQEGYTREELWNGLVRGMAESCYAMLLRGTPISGKALIIGGLVRNSLFCFYFSNLFKNDKIIIPEEPETFIARCSFYYLQSVQYSVNESITLSNRKDISLEKRLSFLPNTNKLDNVKQHYDRYDNEINIDKSVKNSHLNVYFGVDVGSTSTKAAVRNAESGDLLFNIYRKTAGNPIHAYQQLLKGIREYCKTEKLELSVQGMGTTGSGRKIVAAFAGADIVINEITAHLEGVLREHPEVKTVFEIGGQDSKYIRVEDGWMQDASMNYICAAGTGSFLEEQAQELDIDLEDFERLSSGVAAPKMNDRCTVFMELDARKLLVDGYSKSEVVTSLLHAVCRNYLHRVVQNRPIEEPILFLGATARNRGLVESFQNILRKKIHTSKHSHIMGALGVTEILLREKPESVSSFKGWNLDNCTFKVQERYCDKCHNRCRIIYIQSGNSTVSWGQMCGKESGVETSGNDSLQYFYPPNFNPIKTDSSINSNAKTQKRKQGSIFIPQCLFHFSHGRIWKQFFSELGIRVLTSPASNREIIELGVKYSPNELCYPMKLAIGHIIYLIKQKKTPVFLPYMIMDTANPNATNSYFCIITQAIPAIVRNILSYNDTETYDLFTPVINLSEKDKYNVNQLSKCLSERYHLSEQSIDRAFKKGMDSFETQLQKQLLLTNELETSCMNSDRPLLLFMGRAYNLYDEALNHKLIKDTARYGFAVLPCDLFPASREDIIPEQKNMYWSYGQKFLAIADKLKEYPNIFPVFLTNFNCGPDSFLLSMLEDIWENKPYLILELDEHSGNAGYLTRIEAFLDRITKYRSHTNVQQVKKCSVNSAEYQLKNKKLLFPPMHPVGSKLLAAAFRGHGYDAVAIEKEDRETFQTGKACLRGSECLPVASTLGAYLRYHKEQSDTEEKSWALFMPCASGPCRFGQYRTTQKMVLQRLGINTEIFSLNSEDNYKGVSGSLRLLIMKSIIITDLLIKLGCRLRPYLSNPDELDSLLFAVEEIIIESLESGKDPICHLFYLSNQLDNMRIDLSQSRPLVGIVGEIYVRSSPFSNDFLIDKIERHRTEAWVAPFMEWFHYTSWLKRDRQNPLKDRIHELFTGSIVAHNEKRYYSIFQDVLTARQEPGTDKIIKLAEPYISSSIKGEAVLTIGRTIAFIEQGAKLIINVAPFSCMPGTIGSIILKRIAQDYSVPIISLYFDGFTSFEVELDHYLNNISL